LPLFENAQEVDTAVSVALDGDFYETLILEDLALAAAELNEQNEADGDVNVAQTAASQ
jgi:hypothetical protein